MAHKDITTKTILKHIVKDIAHYIFHLDLESAEIIETEYPCVEKRHADWVVQAKQGKREFILHIEIQNDNQCLMPLRMLRYYTDIALAYQKIKDIEQYLIYIGKDKLSMPDGLCHKNHQYLPSCEIGLERGEARGEANIIRNMLTQFNDQQIHDITSIHLDSVENKPLFFQSEWQYPLLVRSKEINGTMFVLCHLSSNFFVCLFRTFQVRSGGFPLHPLKGRSVQIIKLSKSLLDHSKA